MQSPFLTGILHPRIVLPQRMTRDDFAEDLPAIFAHEIAHIRSHDLLWMLLIRLEGALLWFHPLMWRISTTHMAACEEACDALAAGFVGNTEAYAETLSRVALASVKPLRLVAGIPMARSTKVLWRLDALKRGMPVGPLAWRWVMASAVIAALGMCGIGGLRFVEAEKGKTGEERFKSLYRLKEGQLLKRIPPGMTLYENGEPNRITRTSIYYWNPAVSMEHLKYSGKNYNGGSANISQLLCDLANLGRYEIEGDEELLVNRVSGDWVVRSFTDQEPPDERIQTFEKILQSEVDAYIHIRKREVEREVIIATGKYEFHPLRSDDKETTVYVFSEPEAPPDWGKWEVYASGTDTRNFLKSAGSWMNQWIMDETTDNETDRCFNWKGYYSAHPDKLQRHPEWVDSVLANLTKQTSIQFRKEKRMVNVWFVTQGQ